MTTSSGAASLGGVAARWRERLGASVGLLAILAVGAVAIGVTVATLLTVAFDAPPAAEQAADEAGDVEILRCGRNLQHMSAGVRVSNGTTAVSDYFVDIEFVRGASRSVVETQSIVVERVDPGASRRVPVLSIRRPPRNFDCRVGDVDRFAA